MTTSNKPDVREYWYPVGAKPSRPEGIVYPSRTSFSITTREDIFHEENGRWMVRFTTTPI